MTENKKDTLVTGANKGRESTTGNHIDYRDDMGFTADEDFKNGILYHGGMILYKETK